MSGGIILHYTPHIYNNRELGIHHFTPWLYKPVIYIYIHTLRSEKCYKICIIMNMVNIKKALRLISDSMVCCGIWD